MVSSGYSNVGEEFKQKWVYRQDQISRDTSLEILLYNDNTDSLDDTSDIGDITTEPDDGNYSRQTVTLDGSDVTLTQESGEIQAQMEVTFDVTNTTGTIDSAGAVNDFTSDIINSEGAANPHLIYTTNVGQADLSNFTSDFTVTLNVLEDD